MSYKVEAISEGAIPELTSYLVSDDESIFFVVADPKPRHGQRCVAAYPIEARPLAARFRTNWQPPTSQELPKLVLQKITLFKEAVREGRPTV